MKWNSVLSQSVLLAKKGYILGQAWAQSPHVCDMKTCSFLSASAGPIANPSGTFGIGIARERNSRHESAIIRIFII